MGDAEAVTIDASQTITVETIDDVDRKRNHPLHLHHSDTPASVLTTVQLTGMENYSLWSRSMLINLRAKSKLGFVLGTCKKSAYQGELEEQWEKCNAFVLAWIMNTVSKELLSGTVYATDAAMVWTDLKERFDKVDGSRSYQLHREICTIHQGNLTISTYFSKLRLLWDEFDALVSPPSCKCDKSRTYVDHLACLRLFAFLMGLNEVYGHARSQILMMNPLPTIGKAYAMLMADEGQRMTASSHAVGGILDPDPTALYAGKGILDPTALYAGKGNSQRKFQDKKKNWDQICDHCKLQGHIKENCFRLIGYPADWKFKKKSGPPANQVQNNKQQDMVNHANATRYDDSDDAFGPLLQEKNMYHKYKHMMDKEVEGSSSKGALDMANMAGPLQWESEGDW
ncbi:hypothetical protein AABB24_004325 [Solanum stoloniferum]|uniref:Retrotransposon Copia-like N-terminal domain-containing protein n=1 Tax=Solanum stoloniferum TaxID=62892 RepID=A0ABD2VB04_9SOLN